MLHWTYGATTTLGHHSAISSAKVRRHCRRGENVQAGTRPSGRSAVAADSMAIYPERGPEDVSVEHCYLRYRPRAVPRNPRPEPAGRRRGRKLPPRCSSSQAIVLRGRLPIG
uniref:(northern house mosquito) hypothetical protein n=1 Tax=Culex pipiens TaxID=7175 RepID=A0A8D8BF78_CULPI